MTTFVDASAIWALLDADDRFHAPAEDWWSAAIGRDEPMVTTNYVLVETTAIAQARHGTEAVRTIHDRFVPMLQVVWIDRSDHFDGVTNVVASGRKVVSLVDRVSFGVMRRRGIQRAFGFDPHFRDEGFELVP